MKRLTFTSTVISSHFYSITSQLHKATQLHKDAIVWICRAIVPTLDRPTLVACNRSKMEGPNTADDKQAELYCHASLCVIGRDVQAEAETLAFGEDVVR